MSDTHKILKEMSQMTAVTGRISTLQEKNLKMFPLVFFEDVTEVKVIYNLSPIESLETSLICTKPSIVYDIILDESKNNDLDKRFMTLEKSVATLFWDGIGLEVRLNNKLKYSTLT